MSNEKILVVDDEENINKLVCSYLKNEQFVPFAAYNGSQSLEILKKEKPDLIILDIMLPDVEGPSLCLEIRKISNAPIIFLSCKTQEIDKIIALSSGGDDYMTKPFAAGELIARIKAHLRRQNTINMNTAYSLNDGIYQINNLKIDNDTYEVFIDDHLINTTIKEFEILKLLAKNPKKVFSTKQIYETIWKTNCIESDVKTIMVYISTLRKKLSEHDQEHDYIISVRGMGYKYNQALVE